MPTLFYVILVLAIPQLHWHWGWLALSLLFSALREGERVIYRYKYTTDESMDGVEE